MCKKAFFSFVLFYFLFPVLTFSGSIQITSPQGGDRFNCGDTVNIRWTSNSCGDRVKIYLTKPGWSEGIRNRYGNRNGVNSCNWVIPDTIPSGNYKIFIKVIQGTYCDDKSDGFPIQCEIPDSIALTSPNGGETLYIGNKYAIKWKSYGIAGNVKIILKRDNHPQRIDIANNTPNTGTYYPWLCSGLGDDYRMRIETLDGTFWDESDGTFTIKWPSLTVISPNGGETLDMGKTYPVEWTSFGCGTTVNIALMTGDYAITSIASNIPNEDGANLYNWTIPYSLPERSNYKVRLSVGFGAPCRTEYSDTNFSIIDPLPSEPVDLSIERCFCSRKKVYSKGETIVYVYYYKNRGTQLIRKVRIRAQCVMGSGKFMILKKSFNEIIIRDPIEPGEERQMHIRVKLQDDFGKNYRFKITVFPEPGTLRNDKIPKNNICYTETFDIVLKLKKLKKLNTN